MPDARLEAMVEANRKFKPEVLRALREFRRARPWSGSIPERQEQLKILHTALCASYGRQVELFLLTDDQANSLRGSGYDHESRTINLIGRLSVLSYLTLFAAACGRSERSFAWALTLFARIFRQSYQR